MQDSLWGNDYAITLEDNTAEVLAKIKKPKQVSNVKKSIKLTLDEKLRNIESNVYSILGKYKDNTIVINNISDFSNYIDKCIQNNLIVIDTETNNSLDPLTCKLMGLCLYTIGEKQAYIPVNHVDLDTRERLTNQLTEIDIHNQLQRIIDNKTYSIFHNGKFDYKVLKCTCNLDLQID